MTAPRKPLRADSNEIARAIATLYQRGEVVELRVPKTDHSGTVSGYFDDHAKLAAALARLNGSGRVPTRRLTQ